MPELDERFQVYRNVSVEGLNRVIDETEDIYDKFEAAQQYVLCYGVKGEPSCSVAELLYAMKKKLLEASLASKEDYYQRTGKIPGKRTDFKGRDFTTEPEPVNASAFLKNPFRYMANMAKVMALADAPEGTPEDLIALKKRANRLSNEIISPETKEEFQRLEKASQTKDVMSNIAKMQLGPDKGGASVEEVLFPVRGGFFERFLNTTSTVFGNFKGAFENFNNPESPAYGDLDNLKDATMAYLRHAIPDYDPSVIPGPVELEGLGATRKARTELCINVLKSVQTQRQINMMDQTFQANPVKNDFVDLGPEEFAAKFQSMRQDAIDEAAEEEQERLEEEREQERLRARLEEMEAEEAVDANPQANNEEPEPINANPKQNAFQQNLEEMIKEDDNELVLDPNDSTDAILIEELGIGKEDYADSQDIIIGGEDAM